MISKTNGTSNVGTTTVTTSKSNYSGTNIQSIRLGTAASLPTTNKSTGLTSTPHGYNVSFTTSPFSGINTNKNISYQPTTYSLSNVTSFEQTIKNQPINFQLQTLASSINSIGANIESIHSYFDLDHINNIKDSISTIKSKIIEIIPYATDEQIDTIQLQQSQQYAMNSEYGNFNQINPNLIPVNTSFETSLLHTGKSVDWGMVVESGGSLYAATKKFEQYTALLEDENGLFNFGNELLSNAEGYTSLVGETLGVDMSEGAFAAFGIDEALGVVGIGALEVGSLAAVGLAAVAGLAILGASYGLYKAFGGEEDLQGIWGDAANYFGGLFSP